ncbi:putative alpha/beta hydrolase family protein DUF2235 [Paucimonas lemoignei]|uniref:Putative alpha/beta hydrolase family protein DUF2235 n=1 Tax=Paucimonas lemoignei TaxID=29443 RepID=A0A4R3HRW3_PAULE|nr:DUF2235 domain-containing protein [Paucimonas lemoignei]TCS31961.1 putative alpha/beta hydrolase family protein DUF2235 [Paucimonas lemoignei]
MNPNSVRRLTDKLDPSDEGARRRIRAKLNQEEIHAEVCKTCPKPIWFTAFFDGTGNNYVEDGGPSTDASKVKYSNIAKLAYFAHPSDNSAPPRTYSAYIQGVGTPYGEVNDSGKGYDNAIGMAAAGRGQARIEKMMEKLERAVDKNWPHVSQINLAVFGFSRGATQARAFLHMLESRLAYSMGDRLYWRKFNVNQKQPEIVVYFMGIMDTVSSTGFGGSQSETVAKVAAPLAITLLAPGPGGMVLGPMAGGVLHAADKGGHAEWANDLSIPTYVQKCIHFVAGHEVREKFPSDSVRRDQVVPPNCVEIVYPGMHSDVGGGYAPSDPEYQEGRSNELARIPLCHMYFEAYKAGVPFKSPAEIMASARALFEISDELKRTFETYMKDAPVGEKLETAIIWHMNRYFEWRESRRRRQADGRLRPGKTDPYMTITDAEWSRDVISIAESQTGWVRTRAYPNEQAIFDAYKHKLVGKMGEKERADFDLFFDSYVHDSIAGFKKQMKEAFSLLTTAERSRWSIGRRIFMGKRADKFLYWTYDGWLPESSGTKEAFNMQQPQNIQERSALA